MTRVNGKCLRRPPRRPLGSQEPRDHAIVSRPPAERSGVIDECVCVCMCVRGVGGGGLAPASGTQRFVMQIPGLSPRHGPSLDSLGLILQPSRSHAPVCVVSLPENPGPVGTGPSGETSVCVEDECFSNDYQDVTDMRGDTGCVCACVQTSSGSREIRGGAKGECHLEGTKG